MREQGARTEISSPEFRSFLLNPVMQTPAFKREQAELRDMSEGTAGGAYPGSGGGYFAPLQFQDAVSQALRAYHDLLDPEHVNYVETKTGSGFAYPTSLDVITANIQQDKAPT